MGYFTLFLNNFINCGPLLVHLADIVFLWCTVYFLIKTKNCTAVLNKIKTMIPQLQPTLTMYVWETGARNVLEMCILKLEFMDVGCTIHRLYGKESKNVGWYHLIKKIENLLSLYEKLWPYLFCQVILFFLPTSYSQVPP